MQKNPSACVYLLIAMVLRLPGSFPALSKGKNKTLNHHTYNTCDSYGELFVFLFVVFCVLFNTFSNFKVMVYSFFK